jgi:hypothetical protein
MKKLKPWVPALVAVATLAYHAMTTASTSDLLLPSETGTTFRLA